MAQQQTTFKAGDVVEIDPALADQWSKATVTEVLSLSGKVYGYVVRVDEGPAGKGQILRLPVSRFRPAGGLAVNGSKQEQPSGVFRPGDTVLVDQFNSGQWKRATIEEVYGDGAVYKYLVRMYEGPQVSGAVAGLPARQVRPWTRAAAPENTTQAAAPAPGQGLPVLADTAQDNPVQFKVGDRVMASSIVAMNAPYRPCTVTSLPVHGTYGLRCDPWEGRPYADFVQFPPYVRAWANATPEPRSAACSADVPQGTVSRSSAASSQLFQRVIYEHLAFSDRSLIGLSFPIFKIGQPYQNTVIHNAMGAAEKQHPNVPLGSVIYPIRSQYVECSHWDNSFDERKTVDVDWACMKDKFGDWTCPVDSTPKIVKRERVPRP